MRFHGKRGYANTPQVLLYCIYLLSFLLFIAYSKRYRVRLKFTIFPTPHPPKKLHNYIIIASFRPVSLSRFYSIICGSFIDSPNTVALSHRKPASCRTLHDSCCVQGSNARKQYIAVCPHIFNSWVCRHFCLKLQNTSIEPYTDSELHILSLIFVKFM